jgi:hypothetical protein
LQSVYYSGWATETCILCILIYYNSFIIQDTLYLYMQLSQKRLNRSEELLSPFSVDVEEGLRLLRITEYDNRVQGYTHIMISLFVLSYILSGIS